MTDTPRRDGPEPTQPMGPGYPSYPAYSDPAYAGQTPYGPTYQGSYVPPPTEQLPQYGSYGYDPYATGQYGTQYPPGEAPPGPTEPKSPRWLWVVAAMAVLLVVGMVIALVVANSSKQETVVAPMPEPTTTTTRIPTTTSPTPTPIIPAPPITPPSESVTPGATETVVYEVNGDGRALNIIYVDTGSLLQTEFNVMLPWRKEVELPSPAGDSASITVINVGRNVTCSVSINGVQVQQNTGAGLTICTALR